MMIRASLLCCALLCLHGCDRFKRGHQAAPADGGARADGGPDKAQQDPPHGEGEHADGEHGDGGHGDGGDGGDNDIQGAYTPRSHAVDEEECDGVAREELERLRRLKQRVAEREVQVKTEEAALKKQRDEAHSAGARVEEQIKELQKLRAELDQRLGPPVQPVCPPAAAEQESPPLDRQARDERSRRVSAMVALMSPAKAAALLSAIIVKEDRLAADVLQRLPQEQAGRVLSQMKPEIAARLAERLGGATVTAQGDRR